MIFTCHDWFMITNNHKHHVKPLSLSYTVRKDNIRTCDLAQGSPLAVLLLCHMPESNCFVYFIKVCLIDGCLFSTLLRNLFTLVLWPELSGQQGTSGINRGLDELSHRGFSPQTYFILIMELPCIWQYVKYTSSILYIYIDEYRHILTS